MYSANISSLNAGFGHRISLILGFVSLPFALYSPFRPTIYLFALALIFGLIQSNKGQIKYGLRHPLLIWALAFILIKFIFYIAGGAQFGKSHLFSALSFLFIPLSLLFNSPNHDLRQWLKRGFIAGVVLSTAFIFSNGLSFFQGGFQHEMFERNMVMHRPYYGMYLLAAIALCVKPVLHGGKLAKYHLIAAIYLSFWVLVIYAKMTWLIYGLMVIVVAISLRNAEHAQIRKVGILLPYIFGVLASAFALAAFFFLDNNFIQGLILNSFSERIAIWKCSHQAFENFHEVLFGVGFGKENQLINACFSLLGLEQRNYNAHNQWLSEWMNSGILGLGSVLAYFALYIKKSINTKDLELILFTVIITAGAITESTFYRINGVLLCAAVGTMLYVGAQQNKHDGEARMTLKG